MPNMSDIMKIAGMKNTFESNHPKFASFIKSLMHEGVSEGEIVEINIIKPDGTKTTANMKVQPSDIELINELKSMTPTR
jgi:hypothetical protein